MNLTSKSRYALKIMMDLAHFGAKQPLVRRGEIAGRQGIPTDYLDQIMIRLRAGKLVESTRGRSGGYRLARSPDEITMWDLFSSVEENMIPVECIKSGNACDFEGSCASQKAWGTIFGAIQSGFSGITLAQLARDWAGEQGVQIEAMSGEGASNGVRECRSGGKRGASHTANCSAHECDGVEING